MNFGSNFNDRKLFTGESKSTTNSVDMNRYSDRFGTRSAEEVKMARMKFKEQLNANMYGPKQNKKEQEIPKTVNQNKQTTTERQFNHIEAMRNIRRGL